MAFTNNCSPRVLNSFTLGSRPITRRLEVVAHEPRLPISRLRLRIFAMSSEDGQQGPRQRAPPGVDTRIHWDNEDEGWVGGGTTGASTSQSTPQNDPDNLLGDKFSDLTNESTDSHYQFLGVSATADMEEIKAAYRRLSKEYHPDTTSLPLKAASEKFMRLREVYNVLSNGESRQFYDWTLAQEAASRRADKMRVNLEDPYLQDVKSYVPVPDMIDRLEGKNIALSDQALSALTIDAFILVFAICCTVYVLFFKEPY